MHHKPFGTIPNSDTDAEIKHLIRRAKITLIEHYMMDAVATYSVNKTKAMGDMKDHTKSMANAKPQILATDIEPSLWAAVQQAIAGTLAVS